MNVDPAYANVANANAPGHAKNNGNPTHPNLRGNYQGSRGSLWRYNRANVGDRPSVSLYSCILCFHGCCRCDKHSSTCHVNYLQWANWLCVQQWGMISTSESDLRLEAYTMIAQKNYGLIPTQCSHVKASHCSAGGEDFRSHSLEHKSCPIAALLLCIIKPLHFGACSFL